MNKIKNFLVSIGLLLISTILLISGSGTINTIISWKLKNTGKTNIEIGIISTIYFVGMFIGSIKAGNLLRNLKYIKSFILLSSISAIANILPAIYEEIYILCISRLLQGISISGIYVIIDSWILCSVNKKTRGRYIALYMIILYGSYSISQYILTSKNTFQNIKIFCISNILIISSLIPISIFKIKTPNIEKISKISINKIYNISASGMIGCLISGILISTTLTILPVYIQEIKNDINFIAMKMCYVFMFAGIVQYPLGIISDQYNKNKILIYVNIIYIIQIIIFFINDNIYCINENNIMHILITIGILSFSIYPISINLVCEKLKNKDIIAGAQSLIVAFGIGSMIGPMYSSIYINIIGKSGFIYSYLMLITILTLINIYEYNKEITKKNI